MSLSTDLTIRSQYSPVAIAPANTVAVPNGGSFSQIFSAVYGTGGENYENYFQFAADTYQTPVDLLKAVAKTESGFNANAVSSCGAQGIMQLMPATARSLGVTNSFDPAQNIMGGAQYLRQMLDCFGGDVVKAVAAYNAGPNAVKKYDGVPPYQETQNYVAKVLGYAGSGVAISVPATGLAGGYGAAASNASLTQDELADLMLQAYRSSGAGSQESAYLLVQRLILQNLMESEE